MTTIGDTMYLVAISFGIASTILQNCFRIALNWLDFMLEGNLADTESMKGLRDKFYNYVKTSSESNRFVLDLSPFLLLLLLVVLTLSFLELRCCSGFHYWQK